MVQNSSMQEQTIYLQHDAPEKPAEGEACNGCGVCCAQETCPAGRLRFWQKQGPCPALEWSAEQGRYHCGLLTHPRHYLSGLPSVGEGIARQLFSRWIAAGVGCDCSAEVEPRT